MKFCSAGILPTPNKKTEDDTDCTTALTAITTGPATLLYNGWWMIMRCWTVLSLIGIIQNTLMLLTKIGTQDLRVRSFTMDLLGKSALQPTCLGTLGARSKLVLMN